MSNQVFEIKRNVYFFMEQRKGADGEIIETNVPIRMSVSFGKKRIIFFAGSRIDAIKWEGYIPTKIRKTTDKKPSELKQRVKNNTTHAKGQTAKDINDKLSKLESGMHTFFKTWEVREAYPEPSDVKAEFSRLINNRAVKVDTFFGAFDDFVKTVGRENDWGLETFTKFTSLKNHLLGFDKALTFEKFNANRMLDYINFLKVKQGNRNTTIAKNIDFVKWFLKWAAKNEHPVSKSALDYKLKLKGTDGSLKKVVFLTIEELKHLNALNIPDTKGYLQRVRDVFVFCCFTGLRYSDAYALKRTDVKDGYITFVTQKTSSLLKVELNKYSKAILDKYEDVPFEKNKALPVITNQKMNEYLKELGELAGFSSSETIVYFRGNERVEETHPKHALLSTHCARKTFVTNLIYMGVSDHVIRQWTGHRDSKSFDVYHKMVDEIKEREMSKFDNI
ncbi:site-specific integrase [Dyadobacter sp. 3J3]|uniref:site-specific integrase n=1 Tax=Dyadobacter sp. 3J3 TaxID=2606600 RepID=UPI00135CAE20|nr:site-specific integrase [Dyadobacter sp. 3J3]